MSSYCLKTADGKKMYRVDFTTSAGVTTGRDVVTVNSCHVTGIDVTLPSGLVVTALDEPVDATQLLVDHVLGAVVPATLEEYKALAVTVLGLGW